MKSHLLLLGIIGLLAGCRPPAPLPTVAAPAVLPPTPPVVAPSPTLAVAGADEQAGGETGEPPVATEVIEPNALGSQGAGEQASIVPTTAVATARPAPGLTPDAPPTPILTPDPTPCATAGRVEAGELLSAVAGGPMRYRVYLPPCYGQDGHAYPTLYLFGGNIHDETFWDTLGIDEAAGAAIDAGAIPPLLIVMPDNGWLANNTTSGPASYEGFALNELIPHIESQYCAWPAREGRAVGGLSRGGYWSLMMAFRRPDLFRSAGAHSPALIDSFAGPAEDPRVTGVVNELGDLRIWVDIGQRDPYLVHVAPLHDALTAAGVAHEWRVAEGIHDSAYWTAHLNDYVSWYAAGFPSDRSALPACQ